MAACQDVVEGVRDRAGPGDAHGAHEAREISGSVLGTLLRAAPTDEHRRIVEALTGAPRSLEPAGRIDAVVDGFG